MAIQSRDSALLEFFDNAFVNNHTLVITGPVEAVFVGDDVEQVTDRRRLLDNLIYFDSHYRGKQLKCLLVTRENFANTPDYVARTRLTEILQQENFRLNPLTNSSIKKGN